MQFGQRKLGVKLVNCFLLFLFRFIAIGLRSDTSLDIRSLKFMMKSS